MITLDHRPAHFDRLCVIWRTAPGKARRVIGTVTETAGEYAFVYDGPDLAVAREEGFQGYPGLRDFNATYNGQAMSSFASRLPNRERVDFAALTQAWGGNPAMSDFELLGATGGRLPTDMFEFVSQVQPLPNTQFFTDLAGLQHYAGSDVFQTLPVGTELDLIPEPENAFDGTAVYAQHDGQKVGYIKTVHSAVISNALRAGVPTHALFERARVSGYLHEVILRIRFG